jgi:hypothetical protein
VGGGGKQYIYRDLRALSVVRRDSSGELLTVLRPDKGAKCSSPR